MKKNLVILALIFSAALNIVFITTRSQFASGLFSHSGGGTGSCSIFEALHLERGQLDKAREIRDRFHAFIDQEGRKIKDRQIELVDLLAAEKPDRRAIKAKAQDIAVLQRQMQGRIIDHLLREGTVFTPEQRRQFFALIRSRIEKSNAARPRWMPRRAAVTKE